jgi:hypothetical protein
LGKHREVVGLVRRDPSAAAQQFADLVDGLGHIVVRSGLGADPELLQLGMQLAKRGQREIHDVVVRIFPAGEYAFAFGRHSNHGKQLAINIDLLAQRSLVGEQLFRRVRAEDDYR